MYSGQEIKKLNFRLIGALVSICMFLHFVNINAQQAGYSLIRENLSSRIYNEFSPIYIGEGLVFCSDRPAPGAVQYKNGDNGLVKLFYVNFSGEKHSKVPLLFSKQLTSGFNDGPASFRINDSLLCFSRNNIVEQRMRNFEDTTNRLGLYFSKCINGNWQEVTPFCWNNSDFNFTSPSFNPEGNRLYFSSNMPGGYGGMDLYYSRWEDNQWTKPFNLGPSVNTPADESFSSAASFGVVYFASDRSDGYGQLDIYYSRELDGQWITPVHLDTLINTPYDDFGFLADSAMESGYFSSNRYGTDDIFFFSKNPEQFPECHNKVENRYCYTFYDEKSQVADTLDISYVWGLGDGVFLRGKEVAYCFPGPGSYTITLQVTDNLTGELLADSVTYIAEFEDEKQPVIESYPIGFTKTPICFNGLNSNLPGVIVSDYFWNFGEGYIPGGAEIEWAFPEKGVYTVSMGIIGQETKEGDSQKWCTSKQLRIFDDFVDITPQVKQNIITEKSTLQTNQGDYILPIRVFAVNELDARTRTMLQSLVSINFPGVIAINNHSIDTNSISFFEHIAEYINSGNNLGVEVIVHSIDKEVSAERLAEMISYFWEKQKKRKLHFHYSGINGLISPFVNPGGIEQIKDGWVEIVFLDKH